MTEISTLDIKKRVRTNYRVATTKLMTSANLELAKVSPNLGLLQNFQFQLEQKKRDLDIVENEIHVLYTNLTELDKDMNHSAEYNENLLMCLHHINQNLNPPVVVSSSNHSIQTTQNEYFVRPPRLEFAKFAGNPLDWSDFWSQFKANINDNSKIAPETKFLYLRNQLTGDAEKMLKGLDPTSENYTAAIELLKTRFGNPDLLINSHMQALLDIKPVKNVHETTKLRALFDSCEIHVRGLKGAGVNTTTFGTVIGPRLKGAVPDIWAKEFKRKHSDKQYDVEAFLEFFRQEVELQEEIDRDNTMFGKLEVNSKESASYREATPQLKTEFRFKKSSAAVLKTSIHNCYFCSASDHLSRDCVLSKEERKKAATTQGRCFKCLKIGHLSKECRVSMRCRHCQRHHHPYLCTTNSTVNPNSDLSTITTVNCAQVGDVQLQTQLVRIYSGNRTKVVKCIFDLGSQRSFILRDVARELQLHSVERINISVASFESKIPVNSFRNKYCVSISGVNDSKSVMDLETLETNMITLPIRATPMPQYKQFLDKAGLSANLFCSDSQVSTISLLIGADVYWKIVTGRIERFSQELVGIETLVGWTLSGSLKTSARSEINSVNCVHVAPISEQLKRFWEIESLGILHESDNFEQLDETQILGQFKNSISFSNKRYSVELPWKLDKNKLDDNFLVAQQRFWNLIRKLRRDPDLFNGYRAVFSEQLREGIIEEVSSRANHNATFYLPHRPVVKESRETTKIRIVFDASSHARNKLSLNDHLHSGPNLLPELLLMLLKFRQYPIGMSADIKQAFHQVGVVEEDRDALRFLWVDETWDSSIPIVPKIFRFTRVPFGSTASPFLLNITIKHHLKLLSTRYPSITSQLINNFYVDDLVVSVESEEEAKILHNEGTEIMRQAGMELVKWKCNSPCLSNPFQGDGMDMVEEFKAVISSVLGIKWNCVQDSLGLNVNDNFHALVLSSKSKRELLKVISSIFDPLGFVSPFLITGKILFQTLWKHGEKWDEPIPEGVQKDWMSWGNQLPLLSQVSVPRYLGFSKQKKLITELHIFCDASSLAYGAVAFLRIRTPLLENQVKFVMSKTRVAPVKPLTLPRLELMGALLASRLYSKLSFFSLNRTFIWTDSSIALFWIIKDRHKTIPFVGNRVVEIRKATEGVIWRHCSGDINPADKLTRGMSLKGLLKDNEWWEGPKWLRLNESDWPNSAITLNNDLANPELIETATVTAIIQPESSSFKLFSASNISNWTHLLRVTSWVCRFCFNSRNKIKKSGPLSAAELEESELLWIRHTQKIGYQELIKKLKTNSEVSTFINNVSVFLDSSDLLRVRGRLQYSNESDQLKHPLLLDSKHHITLLLIRFIHARVGHCGVGDTLSEFRSRYWCPRARQVIKAILFQCVTCRRIQGKMSNQVVAPLPTERASYSSPFLTTGVDFAGPLFDRGGAKCYIALFTCAVTRAVHLELVSNLSTENFILAFKRFISRRGIPSIVISDNAKTFKRAGKDLRLLLNSLQLEQFQGFITNFKIEWRFIVEQAPWWGGFWERLVRSVKLSLKKILGKASLHFEELNTILIECESIINSRPLTYVYSEPTEMEPLTPSHFLIGKRLTLLPDVYNRPIVGLASSKTELLRRWRWRQRLHHLFWRRWSHEYLTHLKEFQNNRKTTTIKPDDIVLVEELNQPRLTWKTGRVIRCFAGRDGVVRSCEVALPLGKLVRRPIQRLCLLESTESN